MHSNISPSEPITYRLTDRGTTSTSYYSTVSEFTDEVLRHAEESITPIAKKYRIFLIGYRLEEPRSLEEYVFELLNLGVLWRAYGTTALSIRSAPFRLLARMGEWRKLYPSAKPMIDVFRGFALSYYLAPEEKMETISSPRSISDLQRLIAWLEATGDFREDAFRYIRWLGYLGTLPDHIISQMMTKIVEFAQWFEPNSAAALGIYTPNVGIFVVRNRDRYRWREDRFSCLRSRTEYHLNMVGAEIMNRAYRKEFLTCERKTVLLPGCMRHRSAEECEGIKGKKGIHCTGCEPKCRVNQLQERGKRKNFDVMVIPHSSDLSQWKSRPGEPKTAVVGVACLSVLVQGGWELQRNNVPAQCILLNECGCQKHWDRAGFPTSLDVQHLHRAILNAN